MFEKGEQYVKYLQQQGFPIYFTVKPEQNGEVKCYGRGAKQGNLILLAATDRLVGTLVPHTIFGEADSPVYQLLRLVVDLNRQGW